MRDYLIRLYALRTRRRGYEVTGMKSVMDLIGLAEGRVRPPLSDLCPDEVDDAHRLVEKWKTVL
jgi:5-dehydro-4-deoxyglucarate dehydratase